MPHSPKGRNNVHAAGGMFAAKFVEGDHAMNKGGKEAPSLGGSPGLDSFLAEERMKGMPSGYEYGSDVGGGSPLGYLSESAGGANGKNGFNLSGRSMRNEISDFLKKLEKDRKIAVQQKNLRENSNEEGDLSLSAKSNPTQRSSVDGDFSGLKRNQSGSGFLAGYQNRKRSVTFGQPPVFGNGNANADMNNINSNTSKRSKRDHLKVDTGAESDSTFDGEACDETWIDTNRIKHFETHDDLLTAEDRHESKKVRVSTPTRRPSLEERILIENADAGCGGVAGVGAAQAQVQAEMQIEEMTAQSIENFIACARRAQTAKLQQDGLATRTASDGSNNGRPMSMAEKVIADHFWERRVEGVKKYASESGLDIGFAAEREDERKLRLQHEKELEKAKAERIVAKRQNVSQMIDDAMRFHGKKIAFRVACANGEPVDVAKDKAEGGRLRKEKNALLCFDKPQTDFSAYTANPSPKKEKNFERQASRGFSNSKDKPLNGNSGSRSEAESNFGGLASTNGTNGFRGFGTFQDTFVICESPLNANKKSSISGLDKVDTDSMLDFKLDLVVEMLRKSKYNVVYSGRGLSSQAGADGFAANSVDPERLKLNATGAHYLLSALEREDIVQAWVQPCPDRLAQKGGFPQHKLLEVFGAWGDSKNPALSGPPGVVGLDKAEISTALDTDKKFDEVLTEIKKKSGVCLCIGSSLSGAASDAVALASAQVSTTLDGNGEANEFGNLVIINPKQTAQDHKACVRIWGKPDEILNKLAFRLLFEQRHNGVKLDDMEFPNPVHASEAEAKHEISERQGRLVEECMRTGNRWIRKYPHCNYHTGDAC